MRTVLLFIICFACAARADSVINSVHNLAASGPGTIKSTTENNPCIFCHTVHKVNGESPLWNHAMSSVTNYIVYSSPRLQSLNLTVPQPNGSSRLCLSCHDGTVALGSIDSSVTPVQVYQNGVSITTMPAGQNNLGTDLSTDHPVSMDYDSAAQADTTLQPRAAIPPAVKLEQVNGAYCIQCTSCHNPHDDQFGNFLVMDNTSSALCTACHQPGQWSTSAHAMSQTPAPQAITSKIPVSSKRRLAKVTGMPISAVGCNNCHMNHKSGARQHLLESAVPEQNCLVCHNGVTVKRNLAADFQKPSVHPITLNSRAHSPAEDLINPKVRHVVCVDCHDAHSATSKPAIAPTAPGAIANVPGMTDAGSVIKSVQNEYELCFRCHADSIERGPATVTRQYPQTNTRLQFTTANQSFHPVERAGKNRTSVPSLISPLTVNSVIYCSDCHNSDSGTKAGGSGANGPHGSIYRPILERNLSFVDEQPESVAAYAMCYKCHDRNVILSNQSFRFHYTHVVNDHAACTTCHDSHGVANAPHLMNFNTTYVTNSSMGAISYISTGTQRGICTLSCHGKDHKNTAY